MENLKDIPGLTMPAVADGNKHVFHLFPVMIEPYEFGMNKDDFIDSMHHRFNIKVGFHYIPLHWTTAFKKRGFKKGQYPNADKVGEQLVTLPINPRQSRESLDYLIESIRKISGRN